VSIAKANAIFTLSGYSVTYDGQAHSATGTAKGVQCELLAGLDFSATTHTKAGSYSDAVTFVDVTGNYNDDATLSVNDSIAKANATFNLQGYSVTYDGQAHTATGTAKGVQGELLAGLDFSATTHTKAGSYSDAVTFVDVTGNYNDDNTLSVNDSIAKANATFNLQGYSVTYDGQAHTATGTAKGVQGELLAGLDFSATTHTNAGSYSDAVTFTDVTGNYNDDNTLSVNDSIAKANATFNLQGYSVTYDGQAHTATGTAKGVQGELLSGLDFSATTHTKAGSYSDAVTFTDVTGNYNDDNTLSVNDSIAKANATFNLQGYSVTYDGQAHTATGTAKGVQGELLSGLDFSATTHTKAGSYSDAVTFTDVTGNYNDDNTLSVNDSIAKANAIFTLSGYSVTYDGQAHTATGTAKGVQGELLSGLDFSATTHTKAGSYSDAVTFTDVTGNYNDDNTLSVNDSIAKANAIFTLSGYSVTYDGQAHTATGTAKGVQGELLAGLDFSATTYTNGGSYSDAVTIVDVTGNYNDDNTLSVNDSIAKANAIFTLSGYSVTYDGLAHTATGTAKGVQGELLAGLDFSATT